MLEKNKPLVSKGRFGRFNTTVKVRREMYVNHIGDAIYDEAQKIIRIAPLLTSVGESAELISNIYPNSSDSAIQYLALVGSFAKVNLNEHLEHYKYVKNNINTITEVDYDSKLTDSLRGFKDYDMFIITKKTIPRIKSSTLTILKSLLPMPRSIEGLSDGWDIHDESIRDEEQILEDFRSFETGQFSNLNKHQFQFVDKNQAKDRKPVILWENVSIKPEVKEKVESSLRTCCLRSLSDYFSQSLIPYIREFREELPKDYEEIVNGIVEEMNTGQYRIPNPEVTKQLLTQLTI